MTTAERAGRSSYTAQCLARLPHQGPDLRSVNMPYGTFHRREDHKICGSSKNHGSVHQPKDEAGVTWQKNGVSCLPKYLQKDQEVKIRYAVEKMNTAFETKKKKNQCFPTKK